MPKGDIVQNLLEVAARSPATRVMILTAFSDEENVLNAAKGGAKGYVPKGVPSATLLQAIKIVQTAALGSTRKFLPGKLSRKLSRRNLSRSLRDEAPQMDESIKTLTKREMEILRLVAEGLTNEEIGKKIFISEKTVKTHLTNIFDKLKVNNRFKAALMLMGHPH